MADINIQRKSGVSTAVWWILGILAAVIILWMLFAWAEPEGVGRLGDQPAPIAMIARAG